MYRLLILSSLLTILANPLKAKCTEKSPLALMATAVATSASATLWLVQPKNRESFKHSLGTAMLLATAFHTKSEMECLYERWLSENKQRANWATVNTILVPTMLITHFSSNSGLSISFKIATMSSALELMFTSSKQFAVLNHGFLINSGGTLLGASLYAAQSTDIGGEILGSAAITGARVLRNEIHQRLRHLFSNEGEALYFTAVILTHLGAEILSGAPTKGFLSLAAENLVKGGALSAYTLLFEFFQCDAINIGTGLIVGHIASHYATNPFAKAALKAPFQYAAFKTVKVIHELLDSLVKQMQNSVQSALGY